MGECDIYVTMKSLLLIQHTLDLFVSGDWQWARLCCSQRCVMYVTYLGCVIWEGIVKAKVYVLLHSCYAIDMHW